MKRDGGESAARASALRRSWESTASRHMEDCTMFIRAVDVGSLGVLTHADCLAIGGIAGGDPRLRLQSLCSSRANCALAI